MATTQATNVSETPARANALVDSIGINTHFHYTDTPYVTNYATVQNLLTNLGIRHIRDSASFDGWLTYNNHLSTLGSLGIHADIVTLINEPTSMLSQFVAATPNSVESIEGPNEYDLNGGSNWASTLIPYTKSLYSGIKSTPALSSLPVIGPSLTSQQAYDAVGNLAAYMDAGNMHNYEGNLSPDQYNSIPYSMSLARATSSTKPLWTTETGYLDYQAPVTPAVKARYLMRTILEQWNAGVARSYIYELLDEGGQNYGIVDASSNTKPAYVALQGMIHTLNDPGSIQSVTPLSYTMTADPSVHHTLVEKRDKTYRLLLWIDTPATDPTIPTQTVTITTPTTFKTIVQYQWQDSGTYTSKPLTKQSNGAISLTVTDRVTELKLQQY